MHVLSNLEKMDLAHRFPAAFQVGCVIGAVIPIITLGAKVAAQNVHPAFWSVAVAGGVVGLLSLYTFGLGAFGSDGYGKGKAVAFCALIEFAWLLLPYHVLPTDRPIYGMEVEVGLQWFFFGVAAIAFVLAMAVNGVEIAATMAQGFQASVAEKEARERERVAREAAQHSRMAKEAQQWRNLQASLRLMHQANQRPRVRLMGTKYVLVDAVAEQMQVDLVDVLAGEESVEDGSNNGRG